MCLSCAVKHSASCHLSHILSDVASQQQYSNKFITNSLDGAGTGPHPEKITLMSHRTARLMMPCIR